MTGVVEDLHDALALALTTDATFVAALTQSIAAGGVGFAAPPGEMRSNRPLREILQLHQSQIPTWVIETGTQNAAPLQGLSDDAQGLVVGGQHQSWALDITFGLVWNEQDRDAAYRQRIRLQFLLPQLLLRLGDLGVNWCASCVVTEIEPDQGLNHPAQMLAAVATAAIAIPRS